MSLPCVPAHARPPLEKGRTEGESAAIHAYDLVGNAFDLVMRWRLQPVMIAS